MEVDHVSQPQQKTQAKEMKSTKVVCFAANQQNFLAYTPF